LGKKEGKALAFCLTTMVPSGLVCGLLFCTSIRRCFRGYQTVTLTLSDTEYLSSVMSGSGYLSLSLQRVNGNCLLLLLTLHADRMELANLGLLDRYRLFDVQVACN
jgi:hypothetical protein